jgi:hypothetical protein
VQPARNERITSNNNRKHIMTTALEATDKDFEEMMQMLTGFWVTQIAGAAATYSIADHLAKGPATAEEISKMADRCGAERDRGGIGAGTCRT